MPAKNRTEYHREYRRRNAEKLRERARIWWQKKKEMEFIKILSKRGNNGLT